MVRLDKRTTFGPMYAVLVKARHSHPVRMGSAMAMLPSQYLRARANPRSFAVDIEGVMGMGAVLAFALRLYHHAELRGLEPHIVSTNPLYSSGPGIDCLAPYLGAEGRPSALRRPLRFRNSESLFHLHIPCHLPLSTASRLFWTHLTPKDAVRRRVDAVLAAVPDRRFDLSLHYRGTDKFLEAERTGFGTFEAAIGRHQAGGGLLRHVFLATDDPAFEELARERWPATVFSTFNLGAPKDVGTPRHFSEMRPEDKALEAIVNMFLLAEAPRCVRTSSYMSALSKIVNPTLRTVTLNRTFNRALAFPEHEIVAGEAGPTVP